MALSEFVSNWNETVGFKIKVANLTKPDQEFLTNALLAYLEKLDVDVGLLLKLRYSDVYEDRRRFKLGLRRAINDIYKNVASASPENEFYYMDLLKPAPKKTTELLRFLLNYLLFYNQLQNEISMEDKIKERDDKIKIKKKLQTDIEKKNCEAESIENRIQELQEILPKLSEKENDLEKTNIELKKATKDLEESLVEIDLRLINLKQKLNEVMEKVIPAEELDKKLTKKCSLKNSVQEALQAIEVEIKKNNECTFNIENLKGCVKQINEIIQVLPSENALKNKRSLTAQCKDLSKKIINQKADVDRITNIISVKKSLLDKMKKKNKVYHEKMKTEKTDVENKIKESDNQIRIATNLIEELDERLHEVEELIEEQERIKETIVQANEIFTRVLNG